MKKLSAMILTSLAVSACQHVNTPSSDTVDTSQNLERWPAMTSPLGVDADLEAEVGALLAKMTLEEKVGQTLQAEIQTIQPGDVKKYHLGSVLNGGGSMPYRKSRAPASEWIRLADSLYEESMDASDGFQTIPVIWGSDAVHGHNNVTGATIFPHNMGLGATRNPALIKKIGEATAKEVRATGIDWVFAPTIAVAQNDLWGRTYESYSEDPAIVATFSKAMVEGLQGVQQDSDFLTGEHVVACAKHFLGDGGTFGGDDQGDTRISEEALVNIHNAGYPPALQAGVQTVMSSFSSWNGKKMHGNQYLLTQALKERMGFDGFVVGDWNGHGQVPGCTNESCPQAINAGVDLMMVPYDWRAMYDNRLAAVNNGEISMARLDDAVRRILRVKIRAGLFNGKPSDRIPKSASTLGSPEHRAIARQAARESLVLLKNNGGLLPLAANQTVLVAGPGANNIGMQSGGWSITWQGTGTTNEDFPGATSIYAGLKTAIHSMGGQALLSEDGSFKQKPDVAIVVFGEQPYAEGQGDRDTLEFQPGNKKALALLKRLQAQGIPVVSVFLSGRPLWVNPEINASDAFVAAWLPGSEGAGLADVIVGDAKGNPRYDFKGLLSFSWPATPLQTNLNGKDAAAQAQFPLGYGLSYTKPKTLATLEEDVPGITLDGEGDIGFYMGRPMQPWIAYAREYSQNQALSGSFAKLSSGNVTLTTADKDVQEDALRLTWKDTWDAGITFQDGESLDLNRFVSKGLLSFDIKINQFNETLLNVAMACGPDCPRKVSLDDFAKTHLGQGWQTVRIPLACFKRNEDDFSTVTQPFAINTGGTGEIELANIQFLEEGSANIRCRDYESISTTPEPHEVYWAKSWWMPRHEAILARNSEGPVDLIMVGDSITEGWENAGKDVWAEYYANRNAVNMGFGGDRTEHVLWRIENGELDGIQPKVAVLMIGTNNTGHRLEAPAQTVKGIRAILDEMTERLPDTKILLLNIFPRDANPDAPMREINRKVNAQLQQFNSRHNVEVLNINQVFLDDKGVLSREVMPDFLHPNAESYKLWAKAMEPTLKRLLGE